MAKRPENTTTRFNLEVSINNSHLPVLTAMVSGDVSIADSDKIRSLIEAHLAELAGGGMMLSPEEMARIEETTGASPESGEELLEFISAGTGMAEGKYVIQVMIDPAYYPGHEEIAKTQERTVEALIQETVDHAMDNGWCYEITPRPAVFRMMPEEKKELEDALGATFSNGTELAALVRKSIGMELPFESGEAAPVDSVKKPAEGEAK